MPKATKDLAKCKHPNSRKTLALIKQAKKISNRQKAKVGQNIKQQLLGEKCLWFQSNVDPEIKVYNAQQTTELIEKYLARFDQELQQITLKHSIGGRLSRQHANREDVIRLTRKQEKQEFATSGIEMPDVMDEEQLEVLKSWNGELRFLQNLKLRRIGKPHLANDKKESEVVPTPVKENTPPPPAEMETVDE